METAIALPHAVLPHKGIIHYHVQSIYMKTPWHAYAFRITDSLGGGLE